MQCSLTPGKVYFKPGGKFPSKFDKFGYQKKNLTKYAYPTKYRDVEISEQSSRVLNRRGFILNAGKSL